jgi:hypothetical protein
MRYDGRSGGTITWSFLSTVSRSAEPAPCAIQVPEQARITGSSAVTRPLAGRWISITLLSFFRTWIYGSRFDTMRTSSPFRSWRRIWRNASGPQLV